MRHLIRIGPHLGMRKRQNRQGRVGVETEDKEETARGQSVIAATLRVAPHSSLAVVWAPDRAYQSLPLRWSSQTLWRTVRPTASSSQTTPSRQGQGRKETK